MNREECVKLTKYIAELCPQQHIGKATGLVWHDVLGHLDHDECKRAAVLVAARQPFVSPAELIAEIAAERSVAESHSNACRGGDCRNCLFGRGENGWCMCVCHPRAIRTLAGPEPEPVTPALPAGRRRFDPRQITIGRVVDE